MTSISQFKKAVSEYRKLYERAKAEGLEQFIYQGQDVLVAFAKYHLEYLEGLIKEGRRPHDKPDWIRRQGQH